MTHTHAHIYYMATNRKTFFILSSLTENCKPLLGLRYRRLRNFYRTLTVKDKN